MIERINTEAEFRELAARLKRKYGRIDVTAYQVLLNGKWFVHLHRWCKDFPAGPFKRGAWSCVADFVTMDEAVMLRLMDLGKRGSK